MENREFYHKVGLNLVPDGHFPGSSDEPSDAMMYLSVPADEPSDVMRYLSVPIDEPSESMTALSDAIDAPSELVMY